MAREQTEDLPTRGLRPANVQGGQYRVAVQQAPESKLMGLARGLSSVNKGLEAYTNMGGTLSEMYEEEVKDMTLDQLKAQADKMQQRLDGSVRKGKLPFLGNPLNWERNQRALAREYAGRLHDSTVSSDGRFHSGRKQGDENLPVSAIIDQERESFLVDNPELMQNPIMLQGFDAEWQQRSKILEQRFSDQKRKEFLMNTTKGSTNGMVGVMLQAADNLDEAGNLSLTGDQEDAMQQYWSDINALSPTDQRKVIQTTAQMLAYRDPAMATKFLNYAKNFQVGGQLYSKDLSSIIAVEQVIDRIAEQAEDDAVDEHEQYKKAGIAQGSRVVADYTVAQAIIAQEKPYTWKQTGETYTDSVSLREAFSEYATKIDNSIAGEQIIQGLNQVKNIDPKSEAVRHILTLGDGDQTATNFNRSLSQYLSALSKESPLDPGQSSDLVQEYSNDLRLLQNAIAKDLAGNNNLSTYFGTPEEQAAVYQQDVVGKGETFNRVFNERARELQDEYRVRANNLKDQAEKVVLDKQQEENEPSKEELKPIQLSKFKDDKAGKELAEAMDANLKTAMYGDASTAAQASRELFSRYDTEEVRNIINGTTEFKAEPKVTSVSIDPENPLSQVDLTTPGVPYTNEDRAAFEKVYLKIKAIDGAFIDLDRMKPTDKEGIFTDYERLGGYNSEPTGYEIDARKLNAGVHRILTFDEVDTGTINTDSIKTKAERMGISPTALLEGQKQLYKQHRKFFERMDKREGKYQPPEIPE
tara:strand:+ start:10042 stop:12303 length:2262 start_codon:yes stop_codon:yes gene_type:complete